MDGRVDDPPSGTGGGGMFTGVKVFSATKAKERDDLGEQVTRWLRANGDLEIVDRTVIQSSDNEFHCLTIVIFYRPKSPGRGPSAAVRAKGRRWRWHPRVELGPRVVLVDAQPGEPECDRQPSADAEERPDARVPSPPHAWGYDQRRGAGQRFERVSKLQGAVRAGRGILLEAPLDERVPSPGEPRNHSRRGRELPDRQFPGEKLVDHYPEGIEVRAVIRVVRVLALLGRHVVDGSHRDVALGERFGAVRV